MTVSRQLVCSLLGHYACLHFPKYSYALISKNLLTDRILFSIRKSQAPFNLRLQKQAYLSFRNLSATLRLLLAFEGFHLKETDE